LLWTRRIDWRDIRDDSPVRQVRHTRLRHMSIRFRLLNFGLLPSTLSHATTILCGASSCYRHDI
jgi:hypothetical protein